MFTQVRVDSHVWETGDGVFVSGDVELQKGRRSSTATVTLADPRLELASTLPLPLRKQRPSLEVAVGPSPSSMQTVFSGFLSEISANGLPGRVQLRGVDKGRRMRAHEHAKVRSDLSALSLIRELADEDGLKVDARRAPKIENVRWATVCMYGETAGDVLDRLLPATGHTWHIEGDTIILEEIGAETAYTEVLYGSDVRNGFEFRIEELRRSTTPNIYSVEGDALYSTGELDDDITARIVALERTGLTLAAIDSASFTSQAIEQTMAAQSRTRRVFSGRLHFTTIRPELRLRSALLLRGFGPRFSGVWFIDSIRHPLNGGGGTTVEIYNGGA